MSRFETKNKLNSVWIFLLGIVLIVLIKALEIHVLLYYGNYLTYYSMMILCLVPLALIAWNVGLLAALIVTLATGAGWIYMDLRSGDTTVPEEFRYWNAGVNTAVFLVFVFILASLRKALDLARELAKRDELTDTLTVRSFLDRSSTEISRSFRYKRKFTLICVDVDGFRELNDRSGHQTGNDLLVASAKAIKDNIRTVDVLARVGADEFAILLPETNFEQSQIVVPRVHQRLQDCVKDKWPVTFSMGAVSWAQPPRTVDEMMAAVHTELNNARKEGKNLVKHVEQGKEAPPSA